MMQIEGKNILNTAQLLSQAVNRLQLHEHSPLHCLRKSTRTGNDECRFDLPDSLRDKGVLGNILAATGLSTFLLATTAWSTSTTAW